MKSTIDANEITVGMDNRLDESIIFESFHARKIMQPMQWLQIICPPQMYVQLPHAYYIASTRSGRPVEVERVWGKQLDLLKQRDPKRCAFSPEKVKF